ncbi:MAG: HDOD domain-containing protein [Nitrospiraceae bacterium]|nr:MAG: HDOD domain-containing protein [Nitrospiraceae bacterium]
MSESLKHRVQQIKNLPTVPVIAQQVLGLIKDDLISVSKLEKIVENDPAISAKILSVANSAYFKSKTPTRTLSNAILRIGFNNVRNIALGISLMTVFDDGKRGTEFDYHRIFNHSVSVGFTAGMLSQYIRQDTMGEILINGLLHDIGYLIMNRYFIEDYRKVIEMFEKEGSLLDAEKKVLEFTHAEIGGWLADKWNLPGTVSDTIAYHHVPSLAKKNLKYVAVIHIADYITTRDIFSPTKRDPNYPFDPASLEVLGISENDLKEIEAKIAGENLSKEIFD